MDEEVLGLFIARHFATNQRINLASNTPRKKPAPEPLRRVAALFNYAEAHNNLAIVMVSQDKRTEVIEYLQRSLDATAGDSWALQNLVWLLATCSDAVLRNGPEALELARRADSLSGGADPVVFDILAAAYAEAGQFPDAVETARRALDLATGQNNATSADAIRMRLDLYELGFPCRAKAQNR